MPTEQALGWIWPKDPRPGNPSTWPRRWRLFDVLRNKGPDIYVGVIRPAKGRTKETAKTTLKTDWARWEDEELDKYDTPFFWARRGGGEVRFSTTEVSYPGSWDLESGGVL
ncbi:hypothetical protein N7532_009267 [Penicillium argentinense]|uniref:Uncharacterized protein n=1 Tax=Penicillium argentinense TaxID=1131581 RepID=A0A9W9K2F3_9EURO|nr:uncharacterized protein N7532_009267 [Penicillium argentinense]KAJ5090583.1 hypothetical protein N7532_009267 [Penicillium argentinense]